MYMPPVILEIPVTSQERTSFINFQIDPKLYLPLISPVLLISKLLGSRTAYILSLSLFRVATGAHRNESTAEKKVQKKKLGIPGFLPTHVTFI